MQIGKELGISEATVRYRIKKLTDSGIIKKFTILLDPKKIGYPTTGILMVKIAHGHFEKASKQISNLTETRHVLQSTGLCLYDLQLPRLGRFIPLNAV